MASCLTILLFCVQRSIRNVQVPQSDKLFHNVAIYMVYYPKERGHNYAAASNSSSNTMSTVYQIFLVLSLILFSHFLMYCSHSLGLSLSLSLSEGGTPARFLIIDDGWQDTTNEFQTEGEPKVEGSE